MSRGLQSFFLLSIFLLVVPYQSLTGQGREGSGEDKLTPPFLKGLENEIDDLEDNYCSAGGSDDIYLDTADIKSGTDSIVWEVFTFIGNEEQHHDHWFDHIGEAPENGVRFFPDSVEEEYYETTIYFRYSFKEEGEPAKGGDLDKTLVYKSAEQYVFGDDLELCEGDTGTLTLENSESSYEYTLIKDGSPEGLSTSGSDGVPIEFDVSEEGVYEVEARRNDLPECPILMDGAPEVTVNPLPDVSASTSTPEICEGETIYLEGGPDDMASYYWEGPNGFTSDEQNPEIPDATPDHTGTYTLTVQDDNTCEDSESVDVTVNENPSADPDTGGPACEGGSITVSANPSETGNYEFEWTKTDDGSFSETSESFTFDPVSESDAGEYNLVLLKDQDTGCEMETTESTVVEVNENPTVTLNPSDPEVCEGEDVTFEAEASDGDGDYDYTWYFEGTEISGADESTYTVTDAQSSDDGRYEVVVTDGNGCDSDADEAQLTVNENPAVTINGEENPDDMDVCFGDALSLEANATEGSGSFSYEWKLPDNSTQTGAQLDIDPVDADHDGLYTVTVTDDDTGCTGTEEIRVNVIEVDAQLSATASTICENEEVTFTAEGGQEYEFFHYEASSDSWSSLQGPDTDDQWIYDDFEDGDSVYARVINTNDGCEANTDTIDMTVYENPQVDDDDTDNDSPACEGDDVQLSTSASGGSGTYSYSWTGPDGFSSDEQNPVVSDVTTTNAGDYEVVVTDDNGCSSATATTTVDVNENPDVDVSSNSPLCEGEDIDISASASGGSGSYSYKWYHDGTEISETSSSFTISGADLNDAGTYEVEVTDEDTGCVTTESTDVEVNENPTVTLNPSDPEVCEGEDVTFEAEASDGDGNYDYTWYYEGTEISGADESTYTVTDAQSSDEGEYEVEVTDGNNCVSNTDDAQLTVNENPAVTINGEENPDDMDVCFGDALSLEANATEGSGSFSYEWKLPDNSTQTGAQLDIDPVDADHDGLYTVTVTDDDTGCTGTEEIRVNVIEVDAQLSATESNICENEEVTFTAEGGQEYEFFHYEASSDSWSSVQGPDTDDQWIYDDFEDGDSVYARVINTNDGCEANTDTLEMTVNEIPDVSFNEANSETEVCEGDSIVLEAEGSGVTGKDDPSDYNYKWYHEGEEISGVSSYRYTINESDETDAGTYDVVAINSDCESDPDEIDVTVHTIDPTINIDPNPSIDGQTVEVTGGDGDGNGDNYEFFHYEVSSGSWSSVQGPGTDDQWTYDEFEDGDSTYVRVENTYGCIANSDSIELVVHDDIVPPEVEVTDSAYCEGNTGATVEVTNPFDGVTYEVVYENGDPVSEHNSQIYPEEDDSIRWDNVIDENGPDGTDYRVKAYWEDVPDDYKLSDPFEIIEYEAPSIYPMTVDGDELDGDSIVYDCNDGNGYQIGLEESWGDDTYVLFLNGDSITYEDGGASPLKFGNFSTIGEYTIMAYNEHCQSRMEGRFEIKGDDLEIFELSATDDGKYCEGGEGVDIDLSGSEDGIEYVLYRDDAEVATETGDGNGINFGQFSQEGSYYVEAESSNGCIYPMENVVEVEEISEPDPGTLTATDEGEYCEGGDGVELQLSGQEDGHTYYLMYDGDVVASHVGDASGDDVNFANDATGEEFFTSAGDYYVIAETNDLGCQSEPGNTVTIETNPLPENRDILGEFEFCPGGSTDLYIENSQNDVEYQLYDVGNDGPVLSKDGDGSTLSFPVSDKSSYTIFATNRETGCERNFEDTVDVVEYDAPDKTLDVSVQYESVSDDPCADEEAIVSIDSPEQGVTYYLWKDGNNSFMSSVEVTESGLSDVEFPDAIRDNDGDYYVTAIGSSGCEVRLDEELNDVSTTGAMTVYGLDADDDLCQGDGATPVSTTGSESGVDYSLRYVSDDEEYDNKPGTDNPIVFEPDVSSDSYFYLEADDGSGCTMVMDSIQIKFNPLPKAFEMSGSGIFCDSDGGTQVGLSGSEFGVDYFLIKENTGQIDKMEGRHNGDSIEFNEEVSDGTYTVFAKNQTTGCTSSMKDTIKVKYEDSPEAPEFSEYTQYYCSVEPGKENITPENVVDEVTYSVFDNNDELVREVVAEDGDVELGPLFEGSYQVVASWDNGACSAVASDSLEIVESVMPVVGSPVYESEVCFGEEVQISYDISEDEDSWEYNLEGVGSGVQSDSVHRNDSIVWFIDGLEAGSHELTIHVESSHGVCDTDETNPADIEVFSSLDTPILKENEVSYCPGDDFGIIEIQDSNSDEDLAYYLFESGDDAPGQSVDKVFSTDSTYFEISEGEYVVRSRDIETGCYSDVSDVVDVSEYDQPEVFSLEDLFGEESWNDTLFMNVDTIVLELDSLSLLEDNVDYYFYNEEDNGEYYDVDSNTGEVTIDTAGVYRLSGTIDIEDANCLPVDMEGTLTLLSKELVANDDSLYLPEGVNSDSVNVAENDTFSEIDEGQLDFRFVSSDNYTHTSEAGDFRIHPDGIVTYDKSPSFYGEKEIQYVVENNNHPLRKDTANLYVYVGNKNLGDDKSIFIPNAFSPNDDGVNDEFKIQVDKRSTAEESTLEVYNRWGTLVYRSDGKNYDNSWDGTANVSSMVSIGDKLPNGVYFYVYTIRANVDGEIISEKFNGYVELRR